VTCFHQEDENVTETAEGHEEEIQVKYLTF